MSKLPNLTYNKSSLYYGKRNEKGLLCNIYTPLQNLTNLETKKLGDFTTNKLSFDLEHPVDIITQDAYDGAVNLIINDGKNPPRLINSRFAVLDEGTFKIPDHSGFKDTNIYDDSSFDVDTRLKSIPRTIPVLEYTGLINNGGKLPCGTYTFYFKFSDADGNETEVIQESGIVQCHIGPVNDPTGIRMGLENESSNKAITFKLSNIDAGFDFVHVLFSRQSSGDSGAGIITHSKILFDYPVSLTNDYGICEITITGAENIIGISDKEITTDYADINSVKTQEVCNNVLLFANVETQEHDWDAIRAFTWKIIPRIKLNKNEPIGNLNTNYQSTTADQDKAYCYYNTKNVYYRVGYWPDEIYRFGIVYIFEDNSLSPVINLQGIDFNSIPNTIRDLKKNTSLTTDFEKLFFVEDTENNNRFPEYLCESSSLYFNKKYRTNSRGVIKLSSASFDNKPYDVVNVHDGIMAPQPLYINFDLSLIGYKYAKGILNDEGSEEIINGKIKVNDGDITDWKTVLKNHKIKGFFFVRQKRIPTIISQGLIISHSKLEYGSLPVLRNDADQIVLLPFLNKNRILYERAVEQEFSPGNFDNLAMLCPDAELNEATFNLIFTSAEYILLKRDQYNFSYNNSGTNPPTSNINNNNLKKSAPSYISKLTNVPEDTKIISDGVNYFSTLAGNPDEPWKTVDVKYEWSKTLPLILTKSTSMLRGKWGPFVGLSNPNYKNPNGTVCPFKYGNVFNIKKKEYNNIDEATDLDFQSRFESTSNFFAITHRIENTLSVDGYRGDCYPSMFTHRMFRNFIDPELPTNNKIVNPGCWAENYAVRCTAEILTTTTSNMAGESSGFIIDVSESARQKLVRIKAGILFLTGNLIGAIVTLAQGSSGPSISDLGLEEDYAYCEKSYPSITFKIGDTKKIPLCPDQDGINVSAGKYYLIDTIETSNSGSISYVKLALSDNGNPLSFSSTSIDSIYPNGFSNEICQAFEIYVGLPRFSILYLLLPGIYALIQLIKWGTGGFGPKKKKVNPKELLQQGGINLKAIFKADDDWVLHGLASINRADINAIGMGQWITFPIMSCYNLAMRDIDFSNATEEAQFNRKRSFYPLMPKDIHNKLRDSNVLNNSLKLSIPTRNYIQLPKVPYIKLEYFTRIHNSLMDSANSITNEFKVMLLDAYKDYEKIYGSIIKLISLGNQIYIIFKHGIGLIKFKESISNASNATEFLGPLIIINDKFGSIWKDSIIKTDSGLIYGVDSVAKTIWRIKGTEVTSISDMKVEKFLIDNLDMSEFTFRPYVGHINIKTHYNAFKHDIMFTYYNDLLYDMKSDSFIGDGYSVDSEDYITYNGDRIDSTEHYQIQDEDTVDYILTKLFIDKDKLSKLYKTKSILRTKFLELSCDKLIGLCKELNTILNRIELKIQAEKDQDENLILDDDGNLIEFKGVIINYYTYIKATRLLPEFDKNTQNWKSYSDIIVSESDSTLFKPYKWIEGKSWSLCWNEDLLAFLTFYDWIPVESANIDNIYFSFDKNQVDSCKESINILDPVFSFKEFRNPISLGVRYNKLLIDTAFTDDTKIYIIRNDYGINKILTNLNVLLDPNEVCVFTMYYLIPTESLNDLCYITFYNRLTELAHTEIKQVDTNWHFVSIFIKNNSNSQLDLSVVINNRKSGNDAGILNSFTTDNPEAKFRFCELRFYKYTGSDYTFPEVDNTVLFQIHSDILNKNSFGLFDKYYNLRTTNNSMLLWKHGLAGVYDNQGKIKPTNWYGKQHEFNFEFVVNEKSYQLKIFNNLKIISNKTEPNKFEYEIVGETYDWYKYKPIIQWINDNYQGSRFDDGYKLVLSTPYFILRTTYSDFPSIWEFEDESKLDANFTIKKLPYIKIELADRKGRKDRGYHPDKDNWSNLSSDKNKDKFAYNCNEPVIVKDTQLNEYRIHTEQLGNNIKRYGRIRGNMQYLEDLWDIEIRPVSFLYASYDSELDIFKLSEIQESRHRDKYIKIKVRYSGEDLAVILGIATMFDYSFA